MDRLPLSAFHRKVCGLVGLCSFFDSFDALVLPSALVVIVTSLHISFVNVGLLLGSAYVGMTFGALIFGWLGEIVGRKPLIVISVGSFGLLSIVAGLAWGYNSLLITRLVQGLALGGEIPVVTAIYNEFLPGASLCFLYTAEMFPTRMRSWAIATGTASNRIGSFVAPAVIGILLGGDLGITGVFAAMGAAALLGLLCVVALGPETSKGTLEEVSA